MWTLEDVPLSWFKEAYDFEPSAEWLQQAQLSALRFGGGCSASFVSPRGLIMTNHHCARGNVASASPRAKTGCATAGSPTRSPTRCASRA